MKFWNSVILALVPFIATGIVGYFQIRNAYDTQRKETLEKELSEKSEAEKKRLALWHLHQLCSVVDRGIGSFAHEMKIVHPCQDHTFDGWFNVHHLVRSGILSVWTRHKSLVSHRITPREREEWLLGSLSMWSLGLQRAITELDLDYEVVKAYKNEILIIEKELDSQWGILRLKDSDRENPVLCRFEWVKAAV